MKEAARARRRDRRRAVSPPGGSECRRNIDRSASYTAAPRNNDHGTIAATNASCPSRALRTLGS